MNIFIDEIDLRRVSRSPRSTFVSRDHVFVSDRLSFSFVRHRLISPMKVEKWPKICSGKVSTFVEFTMNFTFLCLISTFDHFSVYLSESNVNVVFLFRCRFSNPSETERKATRCSFHSISY